MQSRKLLIASASVFLIFSGCANKPVPVSLNESMVQNPQLTTLSALIKQAGLTETLQTGGPYTVFAPTNEAFAGVPAKTLEEISKDPARLKATLTYHLVAAKLMAGDVKTGPVKTVQGSDLALSKAGEFVTVEEAMVQTADINATNGVLHVVDRVLLPPVRR